MAIKMLQHGTFYWGYAERGKGLLAIELFQRMLELNVKPDEITLMSILCACSRCGLVTEKMPMKPDPAIWGALLNACRIHHHVGLGEIAAQNIFKYDTRSVGYYILLSNLYADSGRWDEVAKVRKMMRQNGLIVDPGCSWVEVKSKVHAFLSGDMFHPQVREINAVLEGFYERMKEAGFGESENEGSSMDILEASKADIFCGHSERLAIGFALINTAPGMPV
ncbi:hypothetical protein L6164_004448 [Bauhinia variegata]|uniref:Uncharacterized protein n=1 Tax=Bauhinia variegata TaxID=167791 RepID=A0ACB9Q9Z2_BAUVA|nr:hypothetical protein L6164_004448 [Bauhinia variegata]